MSHLEFTVVGIGFRPVGTLRKAVESCHKPLHKCVKLFPEPENEYDPNAIRVTVNGIHVGYVPKLVTAQVRTLGTKWECIDAQATAGLNNSLTLVVKGKT